MAVLTRRGNKIDFDRNKLLSGEQAITVDEGKMYYCVAPGDVRELATKEDVNDLLTAVPELYDKLQMLVADLENETLLQGMLGDIDANANELVAHKAEMSGKHIAESGSNENGSYVKFDDGTLICYHNIFSNDPITTTYGQLFISAIKTWTFPSAFIDAYTSVGVYPTAASYEALSTTNSVTTAIAEYKIMLPIAHSSPNIRSRFMAVGRWK